MQVYGCLQGLGEFVPPLPTQGRRCCYDFDGYYQRPGVIIPYATGEAWSNQAGGGLCHQTRVTGYCLLLKNADDKSLMWDDDFHDDICCVLPGNKAEVATPGLMDKIDASFRKAKLPWKVDRNPTRINDPLNGLMEAWVPIMLDDGREAFFAYWNCD